MAARDQVLATPELLEHILSQLPQSNTGFTGVRHLYLLRKVSKYWRALIEGSRKLRNHMQLEYSNLTCEKTARMILSKALSCYGPSGMFVRTLDVSVISETNAVERVRYTLGTDSTLMAPNTGEYCLELQSRTAGALWKGIKLAPSADMATLLFNVTFAKTSYRLQPWEWQYRVLLRYPPGEGTVGDLFEKVLKVHGRSEEEHRKFAKKRSEVVRLMQVMGDLEHSREVTEEEKASLESQGLLREVTEMQEYLTAHDTANAHYFNDECHICYAKWGCLLRP